ncbi:MAG: helix-turn-helix domain-containing protein [bacterium]|nr:helix-turn-helix domain-containing protein [bacterium]
MTNKTYNQYCAIAYTLDIVGERWTLLIVRNLLAGQKRFSDLMKGLPGISTNILTDRLKSLEENGLITTRYLAPPAASTVYELTPAGFGLADMLGAIARWGAHSIGKPQTGQAIPPESVIFMLYGVFGRDIFLDIDLICYVNIRDDLFSQTFLVHLSSGGIMISEQLSRPSQVHVQIGLEDLLHLSSGQITLSALLNANKVQLSGASERIEQLMLWVQ